MIEPPPEVKAGIARVQRAFAHLDWIAPLPAHFLHVTLGAEPPELDGPFEIDYRRVNCFHEAVIVEAHAPLAGLSHVSIGYVREAHDAEALRSVLVPLRDESFGRSTVTELVHVRIPVGRTTLFRPWTVLERI